MNKTFLTKGIGLLAALLLVPQVGVAQSIYPNASHRLEYSFDGDHAYVSGVASSYTVRYKEDGEWKYKSIDYGNMLTSTDIKSEVTDTSTNITYPVTGIRYEAFYNQYELRSITIPSSIKGIGNRAFYMCNSLTSINLPEGLESIGSEAFAGGVPLREITIPSTVKYIETNAFDDCRATTMTVLADSLRAGSWTSWGTFIEQPYIQGANLETLIFGPNVKKVGDGAAKSCNTLKNLQLNNVEEIGESAFLGCGNLATADLSKVKKLRNGAFASSGLTSIDLSSVDSVAVFAFSYCQNVKNLTIPDRDIFFESEVWSSSSTVFPNMKLDTLIINNQKMFEEDEYNPGHAYGSVSNFFKKYFAYSNIGHIIVGDNIKRIPSSCFYDYEDGYYGTVEKVTLGKSVEEIGWYSFHHQKLKSIDIPASVKTIDDNAFWHCAELETVNFAEDSQLDSLGQGAFADCTSLKSIDLPRSLRVIGNSAFAASGLTDLYYDGICWKRDSTELFDAYGFIQYGENSNFPNSYLLPGYKLETIGRTAFYQCHLKMKDTEYMIFPSSVKTINSSAFGGDDSKFTNVVFPESMCSISPSSFVNSTTWAPEIAQAPNRAAEDPNNPGGNTSTGIRSAVLLGTKTWDVPGGKQWQYDDTYAFINECPTVRFAGEHIDSIPTHTFYSGTYYKNSSLEQCVVHADVYKAVCERNNGLFNFPVGEAAFRECEKLKEFTINRLASDEYGGKWLESTSPSTVGAYAFMKCPLLTTFVCDTTLVDIGRYAFSGDNLITEIKLDCPKAMVNRTGNTSFCQVFPAVTHFILGPHVTDIGDYAFAYGYNLEKVTAEDADQLTYPTSVGKEAFTNCSAMIQMPPLNPWLTDVIGEGAFFYCNKMANVTLPKMLRRIEDNAFQSCNAIDKLTLPPFVEYVGENAFAYCKGLNTMVAPQAADNEAWDYMDMYAEAYRSMEPEWQDKHYYHLYDNRQSIFLAKGVFQNCENLQSARIYRNFAAQAPAYPVKGVNKAPALYVTTPERMFFYCNSLSDVYLPENVDGYGYGTFTGTALKTYVPNSMSNLATGIGDMAFADCPNLKSVVIPPFGNLGSIGDWAFDESKLTDVVVQWTKNVPTVPASAFDAATSDDGRATLWVPKGSEGLYQSTDAWKRFQKIEQYSGYKVKEDGTVQTFLMPDNTTGDEGLVINFGEKVDIPENMPLEGNVYYQLKTNETGWVAFCAPSLVNVKILEELGFNVYQLASEQDKDATLKVKLADKDVQLKANEAVMLHAKNPSMYGQNVTIQGINFYGLTIGGIVQQLAGGNMSLVAPGANVPNGAVPNSYTPAKMATAEEAAQASRRAPENDEVDLSNIAVTPYEFYIDIPYKQGEERPDFLTIEILDNGSNGISEVTDDLHRQANGTVYNLNGQRVSDSYKGVVIKNGRKMMKR